MATTGDLEKAWKELDELAAKDPEAYKKHIEQQIFLAKDMGKRLVTPAYCIRTTGTVLHGTKNHHVNIGQSLYVQAPPANNPDEVPLLMSKQRSGIHQGNNGTFMKGIPFYCYDVIVSDKVIERSLKEKEYQKNLFQLALDCVEEIFTIQLKKQDYQIHHHQYDGPYGWDSKGNALTQEEAVKQEKQDYFEKMDTQDLLSAVKSQPVKEEPLVTNQLPVTKTGLIQEVSSEEPMTFEIQHDDSSIQVSIHIPMAQSAIDIQVIPSLSPCQLFVQHKADQLTIPMPPETDLSNNSAKFLKKKKRLILEFRKIIIS